MFLALIGGDLEHGFLEFRVPILAMLLLRNLKGHLGLPLLVDAVLNVSPLRILKRPSHLLMTPVEVIKSLMKGFAQPTQLVQERLVCRRALRVPRLWQDL